MNGSRFRRRRRVLECAPFSPFTRPPFLYCVLRLFKRACFDNRFWRVFLTHRSVRRRFSSKLFNYIYSVVLIDSLNRETDDALCCLKIVTLFFHKNLHTETEVTVEAFSECDSVFDNEHRQLLISNCFQIIAIVSLHFLLFCPFPQTGRGTLSILTNRRQWIE